MYVILITGKQKGIGLNFELCSTENSFKRNLGKKDMSVDGSHQRGYQEVVSLKMELEGRMDKTRQTIHKEMENKSQNIHEKDAIGTKSMSTSEERLIDQRVPRISKQCERESTRKGSL